MKTFTKIATSKPVGKVLDNKFVKNVMVPIGNKFLPKSKPVPNPKIDIPLSGLRYGEKSKAKPYKIPDAKYGNGSGWGGEKPGFIKIDTKSKTNKAGEIINPTKKDVQNYNKKYETVRLPANVKFKK